MGDKASDSAPRRDHLLELQNQLAEATHAQETAERARQTAEARAEREAARADLAERQMREIAKERDEWKHRALVAERELAALSDSEAQ